MSHSPGPWRVTGDSPPRVKCHEYYYVATMDGARSNPSVMSDAALIADAPTMLEVLRELTEDDGGHFVNEWGLCSSCDKWPHTQDCAVIRAQELVKRHG